MAFQTGSQLRPELSAVNYTPYLQAAGQAAQMEAQGISELGKGISTGITKGVDLYLQNKDKEKQAQGIIKAADVLSSGFEPILEKVDPRIATALQDLRGRISDPNLSTTERAYAAKSFMESAPTLLNAGVKVLDTQLVTQQRSDALKAKQDEAARKMKVSSAARNIAIGKPVDQELTPDEYNDAFVQAATMREKAQTTKRVDEVVDGKIVPTTVTTNLLTGEVNKSQIREPFLSGEDQARLESRKEAIKMGAETVKNIRASAESAAAQAELADQIVYALEQGATTGPFAEASATVKSAAEAIFGGDYGAAVQKLYVQGAKGLSMIQIRALMKGLGSMSDDDRKAAEKAFLSAKDPKQAVLYYAELARLNKERVDARNAFVDQMMSTPGMTLDTVDQQLSKMKREERFISAVARENVFGQTEQTKPSALVITPEQARAERDRRNAAKANQ